MRNVVGLLAALLLIALLVLVGFVVWHGNPKPSEATSNVSEGNCVRANQGTPLENQLADASYVNKCAQEALKR